MKRPGKIDKTAERIKKWRDICPDLTIRSTFIVGFPGETEDDFQMLLDWLTEVQLDRVGCFEYEPVVGARANDLGADPVPDDVKKDRWNRFMVHQQAISAARMQAKVGQTIQVMVDGETEEPDVIMARSAADAPEIDGVVYIEDVNPADYQPGDFVAVKVVDASDYDLYAEVV